MLDRRRKEVDLLRERYGDLEVGQAIDWVIFRHFKLPDGLNREETELLVEIPSAYPQSPPDNFYVAEGLRSSAGGALTNYSERIAKLGRNWGQFSFHVQDWSPCSDILDGHNLLTFMLGVEKRLKEIP